VLDADRFVAALGGARPAVDRLVGDTDALSDPRLIRRRYPHER
jgi:hypothetical protein